MDEPEIIIRLTVSEFVVLDEFLRRFSLHEVLAIEHPAEAQALWNLECLFEREPSQGDPAWPTLDQARRNLGQFE